MKASAPQPKVQDTLYRPFPLYGIPGQASCCPDIDPRVLLTKDIIFRWGFNWPQPVVSDQRGPDTRRRGPRAACRLARYQAGIGRGPAAWPPSPRPRPGHTPRDEPPALQTRPLLL